MSYAQRKDLSGNRTLAWIFTIVVVGTLLYAIVTGLAFNVIKKAATNLKVIDVEQQPPPPEQPPPPPKDMPKVPPPPMQPPPLVRVNTPPPPTIQTVTAPVIPPIAPPVIAPPAPPPPPAPARKVEPARARANLASLVSDDDYPPSASAAGQQGVTGFHLDIGPDGRVTSCSITSSSGSSALDNATCRIMKSRARFTPARDSNGNNVSDTHDDRIMWRLTEQ